MPPLFPDNPREEDGPSELRNFQETAISCRFVDTKIGQCCNCTIGFLFNAAMQKMHGSDVRLLCSALEKRALALPLR